MLSNSIFAFYHDKYFDRTYKIGYIKVGRTYKRNLVRHVTFKLYFQGRGYVWREILHAMFFGKSILVLDRNCKINN